MKANKKGCRSNSFTLSLTSALGESGRLTPRYGRFNPGTYCVRGSVGPRAGLDECKKSRFHRDSIPWPSSHRESILPTNIMLNSGSIKGLSVKIATVNEGTYWKCSGSLYTDCYVMLLQAEFSSDSTLCRTLSGNGSGITSVHTARHLIDESSLGVQTLAKCSTALHQTQLNWTNMARVIWQSVCQHTHTSLHYSDQKMLPFEGYVANKIAQYLTHIEVSSDKSHKGDTVCVCTDKERAFYILATPNITEALLWLGCLHWSAYLCWGWWRIGLVSIDIFHNTLKSHVSGTHRTVQLFCFVSDQSL